MLPKDSRLEHFIFQDAIDPLAGVAVGNVPAAWNMVSAIIEGEARQVLLVTVPPGAKRGEPVQIWTGGMVESPLYPGLNGFYVGDSYCTRGKWWGED